MQTCCGKATTYMYVPALQLCTYVHTCSAAQWLLLEKQPLTHGKSAEHMGREGVHPQLLQQDNKKAAPPVEQCRSRSKLSTNDGNNSYRVSRKRKAYLVRQEQSTRIITIRCREEQKYHVVGGTGGGELLVYLTARSAEIVYQGSLRPRYEANKSLQ